MSYNLVYVEIVVEMQLDNRTRHQRLEKQVGKAASPSDHSIKIPLEDVNWIHVSSYIAFFWDCKFFFMISYCQI